MLLIYGSVLGAGVGLFLTSNWALANHIAPADEKGKYLGLTNLATAGSAAAGRLGGPLIDLVNNMQTGSYWGYSLIFIGGTICSVLSALLLLKTFKNQVPDKAEQPIS
jgi:MFS family permease